MPTYYSTCYMNDFKSAHAVWNVIIQVCQFLITIKKVFQTQQSPYSPYRTLSTHLAHLIRHSALSLLTLSATQHSPYSHYQPLSTHLTYLVSHSALTASATQHSPYSPYQPHNIHLTHQPTAFNHLQPTCSAHLCSVLFSILFFTDRHE